MPSCADYANIRATQRVSQAGIVGYGFGFGGADLIEPTDRIRESTVEERRALLDAEGFR
jgi:hypothetical protein